MPALHTRSKYDTFVVYLYHLRKEHLLPESFRKSIPCSTVTDWRKKSLASYNGYEFRKRYDEAFEYYELFTAHQKLKTTVRVLIKTWLCIATIVMPILNKTKATKEKVIHEVQRLCTALPKRLALKLAGLSPNAYQYRLSTLHRQCHDSAFALCLRRHPLQLSFNEIGIMKRLLNDERFTCWPVSSIAWYAKRTRLLAASLSTWYKYLPVFGFKRKSKSDKQIRVGLLTTAPNQYLHVDTTFWNIGDEIKAAIVFVSDNFSKAILGWNISLHKNAGNVKAALDQAIQTIHRFHPEHVCTVLMADGGKENHNTTIHELLDKTTSPYITKIVAQKDIAFSNAPIEAINKIMKGYLRQHKPENLHQLTACIHAAVHDYCFVRPHGSLNGMTPMETYTKQQLNINSHEYMKEAKAARIELNRKHICRTAC